MGRAGRGKIQRVLIAFTAVASLSMATVACSSSSSAVPTLGLYLYPDHSGATDQAITNCNQQSNGAYKIQYHQLPSAADGQRLQLVKRLAAKDHALDIVGMDVVWAPEFAEAGWIKEWTGSLKDQVTADTLPTSVQTASWLGKLYGAPDNTNTQLLWYRKDLVPNPPQTWDEMIADAIQLGQQGKPNKIEIQGAQYEGLTVWFNTMINSAGGKVLSSDGKQVVLDQAGEQGLAEMRKLATSPAADPSLSVQMEDANRLAFEAGTAAFELNYPFVYPSAKKNVPNIFNNMGYAPYPSVVAGQPAKVTIGGINLGVSNFSKHPQLAFQAAACLRNSQNQKIGAITGGVPPTIMSLYQDPEVRASYPFADTALTSLQNASVRPQTPAYVNVSLTISADVSPPRSINPPKTFKKLRTGIGNALNDKGLIP